MPQEYNDDDFDIEPDAQWAESSASGAQPTIIAPSNSLTAAKVEAVRFTTSKPGYDFRQVESFVQQTRETLSWLESVTEQADHALGEADTEIEDLRESNMTLQATIEVFRAKGDPVVSASGEYVTESNTEELHKLQKDLEAAKFDADEAWAAENELRSWVEENMPKTTEPPTVSPAHTARILELEDEIKQLQVELASKPAAAPTHAVNPRLVEVEAENQRLQEEIQIIAQANKEIQKTQKSQTNNLEFEALESKYATLQAEHHATVIASATSEQRARAAAAESERLRNELVTLTASLTEANNAIAADDRENLLSRLSAAETLAEQTKLEHESLQRQFDLTLSAKVKVDADLASRQGDFDLLRSEVVKKTEEINTLQSQLATIQEKANAGLVVENSLRVSETKVATLIDQLNALKDDNMRLQQNLKAAQISADSEQQAKVKMSAMQVEVQGLRSAKEAAEREARVAVETFAASRSAEASEKATLERNAREAEAKVVEAQNAMRLAQDEKARLEAELTAAQARAKEISGRLSEETEKLTAQEIAVVEAHSRIAVAESQIAIEVAKREAIENEAREAEARAELEREIAAAREAAEQQIRASRGGISTPAPATVPSFTQPPVSQNPSTIAPPTVEAEEVVETVEPVEDITETVVEVEEDVLQPPVEEATAPESTPAPPVEPVDAPEVVEVEEEDLEGWEVQGTHKGTGMGVPAASTFEGRPDSARERLLAQAPELMED